MNKKSNMVAFFGFTLIIILIFFAIYKLTGTNFLNFT